MPESPDDRSFDVTPRGMPPPTARPIIVNQPGPAGDPMVNRQSSPLLQNTPPVSELPQAPAPPPPPPPLPPQPQPMPQPNFGPESLPPTQPLDMAPAASAPAAAAGPVQPATDAFIPVVPAPPQAAEPAPLPPTPTVPAHQPPPPPAVKHGHGHRFPLIDMVLFLLIVVIAAYLALDAQLIHTNINLPFHVFSQNTTP